MTEETITLEDELTETVADNAATLTAGLLIGFGAIAGAGLLKGYQTVKPMLRKRTLLLKNRLPQADDDNVIETTEA